MKISLLFEHLYSYKNVLPSDSLGISPKRILQFVLHDCEMLALNPTEKKLTLEAAEHPKFPLVLTFPAVYFSGK